MFMIQAKRKGFGEKMEKMKKKVGQKNIFV